MALAHHLISQVIPEVASFLDKSMGVPGANLQFIACGLLFIAAVRNKLNQMSQVRLPSTLTSGYVAKRYIAKEAFDKYAWQEARIVCSNVHHAEQICFVHCTTQQSCPVKHTRHSS